MLGTLAVPDGAPGDSEGSDEQVSVFCTRSAPSASPPSGPTDWPVELEGGPGGSDVVDRRLACSESGSDANSEPSDAESSGWTCILTCTW